MDLPYANLFDVKDNAVEERLSGKVPFHAATALCYFQKSSTMQSLIHELKYRDNVEVGTYLGKMFGSGMKKSTRFEDIDFVLPVPLHPNKLKLRGYNQSDFIAKGIAKEMSIQPLLNHLIRRKNTNTQTKKSIYDRWQNVSQIFECPHPEELKDKHVLIVDDVITSGSTIEGCINALYEIEGIKISVAVLACAE